MNTTEATRTTELIELTINSTPDRAVLVYWTAADGSLDAALQINGGDTRTNSAHWHVTPAEVRMWAVAQIADRGRGVRA